MPTRTLAEQAHIEMDDARQREQVRACKFWEHTNHTLLKSYSCTAVRLFISAHRCLLVFVLGKAVQPLISYQLKTSHLASLRIRRVVAR